MPDGENDRAPTSANEAISLQSVAQQERPSPFLANVALCLGLLCAIGPVVAGIVMVLSLPDLCRAVGLAFLLWPIALILGLAAVILTWFRPGRYAGRKRAIGALAASLIGAAWYPALQHAREATYGPWGTVIQMKTRVSANQLAQLLDDYATSHDGRYPTSLNALAEENPDAHDSFFACTHDEPNSVTDFHYIAGLDQTCPGHWLVLYGHSDLFADLGGVTLSVDGTVTLLDEPELGAALERFKKEYESVRGSQPEIVPPH